MEQKLNSSTNVGHSTEMAITPNPCYVPCGLELNKIYNESDLDTMKRMPDNFVDLTVTSPPYDGLRTYNMNTICTYLLVVVVGKQKL